MEKHPKAKEEFTGFLRQQKHRITPERFEVLDFALDYDDHFGADELYIKMKMNKSNVSRATVYNTLELLTQCEILAKRHFGDNKTHYEASFNRKNHDHLICTTCGHITEFRSEKIQKIVDEISTELGFTPSGYSFNIFGFCKDKNHCSHFDDNG